MNSLSINILSNEEHFHLNSNKGTSNDKIYTPQGNRLSFHRVMHFEIVKRAYKTEN